MSDSSLAGLTFAEYKRYRVEIMLCGNRDLFEGLYVEIMRRLTGMTPLVPYRERLWTLSMGWLFLSPRAVPHALGFVHYSADARSEGQVGLPLCPQFGH